MAHKKPQAPPEEEGEGAPLWIISFADMMSLLMAFFVMLSTFSGFGPSEAEKLHKTVDATLAANYGGWRGERFRTAVGSQTPAAGQLGRGSERPTLQAAQDKGLLKETQAGDFRKRKIFLIESNKVFWGTGTVLSPSGRDFLDALASYAAKIPDRLVISENGPGQGPGLSSQGSAPPAPASNLGLLRAAGALNYLAGKGISPDRCSIAAQGMSPDPRFATQRLLEIALLNASVYE
jgi:flagellar motor protein MotB